MKRHHANATAGFSLIELMTVVSIASILTAIAVPSFIGLIQKFRAMGEANAFAGALSVARTEAIRQGVPVKICISTDGLTCATNRSNWLIGWVILATPLAASSVPVPLRVQNGWKGNDRLAATPAASEVVFNRDGFPKGLPGGAVTFQVDTTPLNLAARHCVKLDLTGRRQVLAHGSGGC